MSTFLLRRLANLIPLLLGISFLSFMVIELAPGDPFTPWLEDPTIRREDVDAMLARYGYGKPWPQRYGIWLSNVALHGDFGVSFSYHQPVFSVIAPRLANTLLLTLAAALVAWGLAVPLGILAAVKRGTGWDRTASLVAFLGLSIPEILLALLMLLLAARTGWFPVGGMRDLDWDTYSAGRKIVDVLRHLVLPALVLGSIPMAARMRQMRASLLDVLRLEYVTTARAKGLAERTVIWKHAVRNALNPLVTLFGFTLASLLSGSFVVEFVFGWPGLGRLTLEALLSKDLYLVMGSVLMASTMLVLGNLAADILLALVDPRIRYA